VGEVPADGARHDPQATARCRVTARELARLHALMEPGERLAGLLVARIGGRRTWRLVLVRDGVRRVVTGEDEQCQAAAS